MGRRVSSVPWVHYRWREESRKRPIRRVRAGTKLVGDRKIAHVERRFFFSRPVIGAIAYSALMLRASRVRSSTLSALCSRFALAKPSLLLHSK